METRDIWQGIAHPEPLHYTIRFAHLHSSVLDDAALVHLLPNAVDNKDHVSSLGRPVFEGGLLHVATMEPRPTARGWGQTPQGHQSYLEAKYCVWFISNQIIVVSPATDKQHALLSFL